MITVCEEVFLLMLDYDTGRPSTRLPDRSLRTALGGALLMDLALADRIDTDLDGLFVVDSAPLQEPALDRALAQIAADGSASVPSTIGSRCSPTTITRYGRCWSTGWWRGES